MTTISKRRSFESGHYRKFLVVIDDSPEFRTALFFAARVAARTGGRLAMLHVVQEHELTGWMPIKSEKHPVNALTTDVVKDLKDWLKKKGIADLSVEAISRSGDKAEEIIDVIEKDEDISVLVLGASESDRGPGPIVSALTHGSQVGDFPIPIYLVPGNLSYDEITALA